MTDTTPDTSSWQSSPATCGIYLIRNLVNGKCYVGSTITFRRRWACHKHLLRRGKHANGHLQSAWNRYGEASFGFEALFVCLLEDLARREGATIAALGSDLPEKGYNFVSLPEGRCVLSDASRAKMSAAAKGRKVSDETRRLQSKARKGKRVSAECAAAARLAALGRHPSDATRIKIGAASSLRKHSAETRAKISLKGQGRILSAETKAKIATSHRGKSPSDATKAKLRARNLGKHLSAETRAKISASTKGRKMSEANKALRRGQVRSPEARAKMSAAKTVYWAARRNAGTVTSDPVFLGVLVPPGYG